DVNTQISFSLSVPASVLVRVCVLVPVRFCACECCAIESLNRTCAPSVLPIQLRCICATCCGHLHAHAYAHTRKRCALTTQRTRRALSIPRQRVERLK